MSKGETVRLKNANKGNLQYNNTGESKGAWLMRKIPQSSNALDVDILQQYM